MNFYFLPPTIGTIQYYASRAITPLFISALFARILADWDFGFLSHVLLAFQALPAWISSDNVLWTLGIISLLEVWATKSPFIAGFYGEFSVWPKTIVAFLHSNLIMEGNNSLFAINHPAHYASFSLSMLVSLVIAALVWQSAKNRNLVLASIAEDDEDDNSGLMYLLSWGEDLYVLIGMVILIFFPLAALAISGVTILALFLLPKVLEKRAEKQKIDCPQCRNKNHPSAINCYNCNHTFEIFRKIGVFGQQKSELSRDALTQQQQLTSRKRCRVCAAYLKERTVRQNCAACGSATFETRESAEVFLQSINSRMGNTLAISLLLSSIPLFGLIPGIIYYRLNMIACIRGYIPRSRNLFSRWKVRIINIILIVLQPIPLLGAACLPLMCLSNYSIYKRQFKKQIRKQFGRT